MSPTTPHTGFRLPAVCFVLLFGTLLLFHRTLSHGFLDLDDPDYVTQNAHVQNGLTAASIHWAFTTGAAANWHPVTWLSLMLDARLYDNYPGGFHFTNNLLHALNAVLAFLALLKLTTLRTRDATAPPDTFWTCAICAAVFAWHPLRVESVAWIAERKDVLSGFFFFTTLLAYAAFVGSSEIRTAKSWIYYSLTLFLFSLGLMSKPMLVTLPFLLLLLDGWPLWRLNRSTLPRLIAEKIPFFALAFASCVITFLAQKNGHAIIESQSLNQRWSNAAVSILRYAENIIWPRHLAIVYPLPFHWPFPVVAGALAILMGITAAALWQSHRRPWILVGWLWFVGLLLPVLGFVQVGLQAMADRYTYLPMLGLLLALFWTLRELKWSPLLKTALTTLILFACAAQTWRQINFWQTPQSLYEHTLAVTKDNYPAECYLGTFLLNSGHPADAEPHLRRTLELKPDFNDARFKLGVTLAHLGRPADAIPQFEAVLHAKPDFDSALIALGTAEARLGQTDLALTNFETAIALKPADATAHYNLANTLNDLHRSPEAFAQYEITLQLDPNFADAHGNYAAVLEALGRPAEALGQYRQALLLDPKNAAADFGLAVVFEDLGQLPQAIVSYQRVIALDPANATAQYNLGTMLLNQNRPADALVHFTAAQQLAPDNASAFLGSGLAHEQLGHEKEAITDYETALRLNPNLPGLQQQLARARQSLSAEKKP